MEKELIELGFSKGDFINSLLPERFSMKHISKHGKCREISISDIGTPNEMIFISEINKDKKIEDMVVIHNYDYDGYITIERIKALVFAITGK